MIYNCLTLGFSTSEVRGMVSIPKVYQLIVLGTKDFIWLMETYLSLTGTTINENCIVPKVINSSRLENNGKCSARH